MVNKLCCFLTRALMLTPCCSSIGRTGRHGFTQERSTGSITMQSFANANNPRLPPYPSPVLGTPVIQIRQNLAIPGLGGVTVSGAASASGGTRARPSVSQGAAALECVCVAACFAPSRGYFAGTPPGPAGCILKHLKKLFFRVE